MRISGAELQLFMNEAWPDPETGDWYWDHDLFDGDPDPETVYDTDDLGPLLYGGRDTDPTGGEGYDLARLIRRWRKTRSSEVITVVVPKDRLAALKDWMRQNGATELKAGKTGR